MNERAFTLSLLMPLLLAACAFGYQARGTLSDVPGELRGKGYPGNAVSGGRFMLADAAGRLTCDGRMAPADRNAEPGSCAGESGPGVVRCSDGREFTVRWTAVTCRSFTGSGEDNSGNRLVFRVDRRR